MNTIKIERTTRRRGITRAARSLGVGYPHLYRCVKWLNGDERNGRKPGRDLERAIRSRFPELVEVKTCSR